jgi:hypothetical protein
MPYYSLPALAEAKGIKPKQLRAWVAKKWLRHSAQTAGGQARYSDEDFELACKRSIGVAPVKAMHNRRRITIHHNGDARAIALAIAKKIRSTGTTGAGRKKRQNAA